MSIGKVISIRDVVVDIKFAEDQTPKVYDALLVDDPKLGKTTLEVQSVLDEGVVRAVAMGNVYGLRRGSEVKNTGKPIEVPVGQETLGRIFNILGEPVDNGKQLETNLTYSIHKTPPALVDQFV